MLSCKEVVASGDVIIAGELGISQKIKLYLHLVVCTYCRLYLRELKLLVSAFRYLYKPVPPDKVDEVMHAVRRDTDERG